MKHEGLCTNHICNSYRLNKYQPKSSSFCTRTDLSAIWQYFALSRSNWQSTNKVRHQQKIFFQIIWNAKFGSFTNNFVFAILDYKHFFYREVHPLTFIQTNTWFTSTFNQLYCIAVLKDLFYLLHRWMLHGSVRLFCGGHSLLHYGKDFKAFSKK